MSRVHVLVFGSAVALLVSVLNFVRGRRLREEYSWLWLLTSVSFLFLTISPAFYDRVLQWIGATNAAMTFAFLGLYFLVFISIQYSVQLSRLVTKSKDLAQEVAILDGEIRQLQGRLAHTELAPGPAAGTSNGNGKRRAELPFVTPAVYGEQRGAPSRRLVLDVPFSDAPLTGTVPPAPSTKGHHAERSFD